MREYIVGIESEAPIDRHRLAAGCAFVADLSLGF
jgi:hypothetical protein